MKFIGKVTPTLAAVAVSSVLAAGGGAYAASALVQSNNIAPGAVTNSKIADGAVTQSKMSQFTRSELAQTQANAKGIATLNAAGANLVNQVQGLAQSQFSGKYSDLTGTPDLSQYLTSASDAIKNLQSQIDTLSAQLQHVQGNVNLDLGRGGWWSPLGNGSASGTTGVLTEGASDANGANLENDQVNLPYVKGEKFGFTYSLADGAAQGWGAPRLIVHFAGDDDNTWYSSINDVNPNYGTDNGDGTYTQYIVPDKMNDNMVTPHGDGVIDRIAVVYDNTPAPGTVTVSDVKVGHTVIPFN